jgi:hypothetical protein
MLNVLFTEVRYSLQPASIKSQIARIWPILIIGFTIALLMTSLVALLNLFFDIPLGYLTRDISDVTPASFYVGFLSSLGIMLWSASAAICLLGASAMHRIHHQTFIFLLCSGLLCVMLTLDDAFLFHEEVFPIHLNIPENLVFGTYFLLMAGYLLSLTTFY